MQYTKMSKHQRSAAGISRANGAFFAATAMLMCFTSGAVAGECQMSLEAAIRKITSSGPVRIVRTTSVNGEPSQQKTFEIVGPSRMRVATKSLLKGEALAKQQAQAKEVMKHVPEELRPIEGDKTSDTETHIGKDSYLGRKKLVGVSWQPEGQLPSILREAMFVPADTIRAISCEGHKIEFENNPIVELVKSANNGVLPEDSRLASELSAILKEQGITKPFPRSTLEISPSGAPLRMEHIHDVPDDTEAAMAKKMYGTDLPKIVSMTSIDVITLDPSIKIEPPK